MVQFYPSIPPDLQEWALKQSIFYTASAPLTGTHVNLSPKGLPSATFAIFGPNSAGYIDATGSGSETISHIYENGRVTIMFCSFGTSPRIMRFFCRGRVVERGDGGFESEVKRMGKGKGEVLGARAVILLDVWKVCYVRSFSFLCVIYQEGGKNTRRVGKGQVLIVNVQPLSHLLTKAPCMCGKTHRSKHHVDSEFPSSTHSKPKRLHQPINPPNSKTEKQCPAGHPKNYNPIPFTPTKQTTTPIAWTAYLALRARGGRRARCFGGGISRLG